MWMIYINISKSYARYIQILHMLIICYTLITGELTFNLNSGCWLVTGGGNSFIAELDRSGCVAQIQAKHFA